MSGGGEDVMMREVFGETAGGGIARRDFLKVGALAGGGLLLGMSLSDERVWALAREPLQPNAFVRVGSDGVVTIWVGRSDMGQGVRTALPMIVADELDADWSKVVILQADADPQAYGSMMTVGSSSVRGRGYGMLRKAGASARAMLVAAAAARWGVDATSLTTEHGRVRHASSERSLSYGELAEEAAALPVPEDPPLKDPDDFRLIGTSPPLIDSPDKVTGRAVYGMDVKLPGMLYATVVHPPVLGGSFKSADLSAALAVPGVKQVVEISRGVAVVAENTWAAFKGAEALDATWNPGTFSMSSSDVSAELRRLAEEPGAPARDDGNADAALAAAARRLRAEYEVPYLAHATMEPMNCTADVRPDRCEIWTPSQGAQGVQSAAARLTGLDLANVTVHITLLGCGWGRKNSTDFVEEAVETSMKVGSPVQLVWSREEDMRNDFYRPTAYNVFEGGLDAAGRVSALKIKVVSTPINYANYGGGRGGRGGRVDGNSVDGSANAQYGVPNFRVDYVQPDIHVPTGHWRSVGPSGNTFMLESFLDEMAHAAGRDPMEVRLELLEESPRLKHVLELAAQRSGWRTPPPSGRARGVAAVLDKGGYVAQVAEVSLEGGQVRVHNVTCVVDAGQVIHRGVVEQQMVGSIVAGLTAAFYGEITLDGGRVVQDNFDTYRMLVMREMPEVDVHIVDSREEPGGVGEPGVPPIAPAVTNALFALTGRRVRRLPIRVEDVASDAAGGHG